MGNVKDQREDSNHKLKKRGKSHVGGHDMVRRFDRHGQALIWCRECSGHARQRQGPKLMNRCKPEKMDTKEYGKMLKRILTLEDGRVPAKNARGCKIVGQKEGSPRRRAKGFRTTLRWEVSRRRKGCGTAPRSNFGRWKSLVQRRRGLAPGIPSHA